MNESMMNVVAKQLSEASRILFVTGAGLSADSGLPTYRGVGGLYEDADTPEGMPIEAVLSGSMMQRNPALVWKHILEIERACRGAKPNRGHEVMAALQEQHEVVVLTQNVDGLHRAAGSAHVIEIHGRVDRLVCTVCDYQEDVEDYSGLTFHDGVVSCPQCQSVVRPAVVLFDEMLPDEAMARLRAEVRQGFDLVFTVGTSSGFPYIAAPVYLQVERGRPAYEINPGLTEVSEAVTHRFEGRAAVVLDELWQRSLA
ncbi:MAG: NAD-dependent protein deacylase [Myxococcota bacterium]